MIEIAALSPDSWRQALSAPGGFAWWYLDLVDDQGSGLVLIWSFGLPFLPGSRKRPLARLRPALNVATYVGGKPDFYLLQEYPEDAAELDHEGRGRLGESSFSISRQGERIAVDIKLDAPVPASTRRLRGQISIQGPALRLPKPPNVPDGPAHTWSPRAAWAEGSAELDFGGAPFKVQGSAYFDANTSAVPLDEQRIESWRWGRVSFDDETLVYYDIQGEQGKRTSHVFLQRAATSDAEGGLVELKDPALLPLESGTGLYGLTTARGWRVRAQDRAYEISLRHLVDDGPFYQRFLVDALRADGKRGSGVAELVVPGRVDQPWQRPFVRMRTHQTRGDNSLWLPLFSGARQDRVQRMTRALSRRLGV